MSEKRFTLSNFASPSQLSDVCDDGGKMLNSEVVDLLNEQSERIKSLEIELDLIANTKLFSRRKLEEENKQLKKENEQLKNKLNKGL